MKLLSTIALIISSSVLFASPDVDFKAKLEAKYGKIEEVNIKETPVKDIYEVTKNGQILYVNKDVTYLFSGVLFEIETDKNLTEMANERARVEVLNSIDENSVITFKAKDEKVKLKVFTDIDCGYCIKLHKEVAGFNEMGVTVDYLAYPRAGVGSDSYNKLVAIWCSEDQVEGMNNAKLKGIVSNTICKNPVKDHMEIARRLGVRGTPSVYLENGKNIGGYLSQDKLKNVLRKEFNLELK